jgi:chemotaxis protein methyltransferase CheR
MMAQQDRSLSPKEYQTVKSLIYQYAGIALTDFKQVMVQGRLNKRMRKLAIDSYGEYLDYLQDPLNAAEITQFINVLTTNKTDFFRESHHFEFLAKTAFPVLEKRAEATGEKRIRIWCSASSTGEEPYTLAMSVREYFGAAYGWDVKILASDIDTEVLKAAEAGVYHPDRVSELDPGLLKKYFDRAAKSPDAEYVAKPTLKELLTFRRLNLHDSQWPINTVFDIIFCRNVMIYFDAPSQTRIISHFGEYLRKDGYLMIGHSESIYGLSDLFTLMGDTVYRKNSEPRKKASFSRVPSKSITPKVPAVPINDSPAQATDRLASSITPLDRASKDPVHPIIIGEVHVSPSPIWISTLLGSCVSVCMYDDVVGVAGMNHFMLPIPKDDSIICNRFGVHAIELLINSLMNLGADRRRLKAKIFGGCNATSVSFANIANENVEFAHRFLTTERIPITSSYTNEGMGMNIQFHTKTFRALVRVLDKNESLRIENEAKRLAPVVIKSMQSCESVTLF